MLKNKRKYESCDVNWEPKIVLEEKYLIFPSAENCFWKSPTNEHICISKRYKEDRFQCRSYPGKGLILTNIDFSVL